MNEARVTQMTDLVAPDALALQRLYHWERTAADRIVLTQPIEGGRTREYTWREVMDQSRRMAAYLKSLGFEPGSRIGLLSKKLLKLPGWLI
jgi:long-chain acyl-CoA synthetase